MLSNAGELRALLTEPKALLASTEAAGMHLLDPDLMVSVVTPGHTWSHLPPTGLEGRLSNPIIFFPGW